MCIDCIMEQGGVKTPLHEHYHHLWLLRMWAKLECMLEKCFMWCLLSIDTLYAVELRVIPLLTAFYF